MGRKRGGFSRSCQKLGVQDEGDEFQIGVTVIFKHVLFAVFANGHVARRHRHELAVIAVQSLSLIHI